MKTEIKVITDNNPSDALRGEWGLCLVVNYDGEKILVDAGASNLFMKNMEELGESIEDVDFAYYQFLFTRRSKEHTSRGERGFAG